MKSVKFFSGQTTQAEDFNNAQKYKEQSILDRFQDLRSSGIVTDKSAAVIVRTYGEDKKRLQIFGFIAYDELNERINVPRQADETEPTLFNLGMEADGDDSGHLVSSSGGIFLPGTWTLSVRYRPIAKGPIEYHAITGEPYPVTEDEYYEFVVRKGENIVQSGDVVLAILTVDGEGVITVDNSPRQESTLLSSAIAVQSAISVPSEEEGGESSGSSSSSYSGLITFEKHINSVGTGSVSEKNPHGLSAADLGIDTLELAKHQAMCHTDGIRSDNIASTSSALYPSFRRETSSNEEFVYIAGLSTGLNELVVVNGGLVSASEIPTYTFALEEKANAQGIGYYLFAFDSSASVRAICVYGPFDSEQNATFLGYINNKRYFPICSLKWGIVQYDYNDDQVMDKSSYDIIPGTFKDRRVFNNTSIENFRPDQVFAITQFAPICNDTAYLHNARIISSKNQTDYEVDGKKLLILVDGGGDIEGGTTVEITFSSGGRQYMQVEAIVDRMNEYFSRIDEDGQTYVVAYARVTEDGYISISAPKEIELVEATSNDAREALGFSTTYKNLKNKSNILKELIYTGERNGVVLFTYDAAENITRIDYLLGGGVRRYNTFKYNGDLVVAVKELVEPL